jgi:hypothetical protein
LKRHGSSALTARRGDEPSGSRHSAVAQYLAAHPVSRVSRIEFLTKESGGRRLGSALLHANAGGGDGGRRSPAACASWSVSFEQPGEVHAKKVTAVAIATAINDATRPYSIAVTPVSMSTNSRKRLFISDPPEQDRQAFHNPALIAINRSRQPRRRFKPRTSVSEEIAGRGPAPPMNLSIIISDLRIWSADLRPRLARWKRRLRG